MFFKTTGETWARSFSGKSVVTNIAWKIARLSSSRLNSIVQMTAVAKNSQVATSQRKAERGKVSHAVDRWPAEGRVMRCASFQWPALMANLREGLGLVLNVCGLMIMCSDYYLRPGGQVSVPKKFIYLLLYFLILDLIGKTVSLCVGKILRILTSTHLTTFAYKIPSSFIKFEGQSPKISDVFFEVIYLFSYERNSRV